MQQAIDKIRDVLSSKSLETGEKEARIFQLLEHFLPEEVSFESQQKITAFAAALEADTDVKDVFTHWELYDRIDRSRLLRKGRRLYLDYFPSDLFDVELISDWSSTDNYTIDYAQKTLLVNTALTADSPSELGFCQALFQAGSVLSLQRALARQDVEHLPKELHFLWDVAQAFPENSTVQTVISQLAQHQGTLLWGQLPKTPKQSPVMEKPLGAADAGAISKVGIFPEAFLNWVEEASETDLNKAPFLDVLVGFDRSVSAVAGIATPDQALAYEARLKRQKIRLALWGQRKAMHMGFSLTQLIDETVLDLVNHPQIIADRRSFASKTDLEKQDVIRGYVHQIARKLQIFPPGVHLFSKAPILSTQPQGKPKYNIQAAFYNSSGVHLNTHEQSAWQDFDALLSVAAHEVLHDWQSKLAGQVNRGDLSRHDPKYKLGLLYKYFLSASFGANALDDRDYYKEHPIEKSAWHLQEKLYQSLKQNPEANLSKFFKAKIATFARKQGHKKVRQMRLG